MAKKAKIELPPNSIIYANWKTTIDSKVDNLVAGMATVDFMEDALAEIKAMFQARQHSNHQVNLSPKLDPQKVFATPSRDSVP